VVASRAYLAPHGPASRWGYAHFGWLKQRGIRYTHKILYYALPMYKIENIQLIILIFFWGGKEEGMS
jgi:hypothetical protein